MVFHFRRVAFILGLTAAPALAHDFWIEPTAFRPAVGATLGVQLLVGQNFRGDALPRNPALIERFILVSETGEAPVAGRAADEPAGTVRIAEPGLALIAYRSRGSQVTLEAARFEQYLREEGLDAVIAARAARGDAGKPGRETFSRAAKSLIAAGGVGASGFDRALGLTLELVPEANPYVGKAGSEIPVRVFYEGRPLAGALVVALNRDEPDATVARRSDGSGRVRLRLPKTGVWLVKTVHMVPAVGDPNADWQSVWASLTFELPGEGPAPNAP